MAFPKEIKSFIVPPIKCQGIKTKLLRFIFGNIKWDENGRWVEPFVGSGVVVFNSGVKNAIINDTNPHIIDFYKSIYDGVITGEKIERYLLKEGRILSEKGEDYYYFIRERFNDGPNPYDFLFLNRAGFNGLMRFNKKGKFNVPFCRKPERFRRSYITKIVNQVKKVSAVFLNMDLEFRIGDWEELYADLSNRDFVYLDPPYIGRHTDYYSSWGEENAVRLAEKTTDLPCGFALSMWKSNKYRENEHLETDWKGNVERTFAHFYHLGSTEDLRNEMLEALIIKPGFETEEAALPTDSCAEAIEQTELFHQPTGTQP